MTRNEFEQFVLEEAKKLLGESQSNNTLNVDKGNYSRVSSSEVRQLSENIKRISKELDFRNPILSEPIIDNNNSLKETFDRMKKLYNFEIPEDEQR